MKDVYILGIESSCDETSISIVKNGYEEIATTVLTQMDTHALYGGVVPEIASRMHTENITMVLEDLLSKANMMLIMLKFDEKSEFMIEKIISIKVMQGIRDRIK